MLQNARFICAGASLTGFDASNGLEYLLATHHDRRDALCVSVFSSGLWQLDGHGLCHRGVASVELPGGSAT